MKILKYTYIPFALVFALLFGTTAEAAISSQTINGTDSDGLIMNIRYQQYSSCEPTSIQEITTGTGTVNNYIWEFTENIDLILVQGKYYTGYTTIQFKPGFTLSGADLIGVELSSSNAAQGLHTYITSNSGTQININFVFDNFYTAVENVIGTCSIKLRFAYMGGLTSTQYYQGLTPTVIYSRNLHGYEGVQNNALTGMIYSAIEQGTQADFDSIIGLLTDIRNQDYTYYNQLIAALGLNGTLHNDNLQIYSLLLGLDAHTQNGFAAVQTILDLFPSYRTAVLNYWQQLLEMNAEQSSAAAEMENQVANQESQSANLLSGLGSVTMPSLSANDLDIMASADGNTKTNFFGLVSIITHNNLITTILLTITTAAIAGFILYGKRG